MTNYFHYCYGSLSRYKDRRRIYQDFIPWLVVPPWCKVLVGSKPSAVTPQMMGAMSLIVVHSEEKILFQSRKLLWLENCTFRELNRNYRRRYYTLLCYTVWGSMARVLYYVGISIFTNLLWFLGFSDYVNFKHKQHFGMQN